MKNLNKLAKLSEKHGLRSYVAMLEGDNSVEIFGDVEITSERFHQETDEPLGKLIGRAIRHIETECGNEPEDTTKIKISVRLDQQVGERWIDHQFDFPQTLYGLTAHISEVLECAYQEYADKPAPYGEWFDRIVILIRKANGLWVELRIARDNDTPRTWITRERYPGGMGKSATFNNRMDETPSADLIGRFIMNTLVIAEQLAERDNPAIS